MYLQEGVANPLTPRCTAMEGKPTLNRVFLHIPPGRRYVRSFLFSRRIGAPLANVHLIARVLLVLCIAGRGLFVGRKFSLKETPWDARFLF